MEAPRASLSWRGMAKRPRDQRLSPLTSRQEKEAWIHAKYVEKKFLTKLPEIRGRRGGRGPPRGHPPVPPKPPIRPHSGIVRSKSGRESNSLLYTQYWPGPRGRQNVRSRLSLGGGWEEQSTVRRSQWGVTLT